MPLPADTYLTLPQLRAFFQRLTLTLLGMGGMLEAWEEYQADPPPDGEPPANPFYFVRTSWPTGGAPAWKIAENVAFLRILESDSQYNRQRDVAFDPYSEDSANQRTGYTRVVGVTWVFYGPSSFDNAQVVRDRIFYQTNHDALAGQNLYLVPDIPAPRRVPEPFQGQWWERTDLSMNFNEKIVRNMEVPYLQSAEVTIKNDEPPRTEVVEVTKETKVHPD
jgi:hypothetical protein